MIIKEYDTYDEKEILNLYKAVGWISYTKNPSMLKGSYENSLMILAAYEEDTLLGIIRVVGDGHSVIFIQDLIVHPDFQRKGIGSALMKEVLSRFANVYQTILMTDDTVKTNAFYSSLGFTSVNKFGCTAFVNINR